MLKTVLMLSLIASLANASESLDFRTWVRNSNISGNIVIDDSKRPAPTHRHTASSSIQISFEVVQSPLENVKLLQIKEVSGSENYDGLIEPVIQGTLQGAKFSNVGSYTLDVNPTEKENSYLTSVTYKLNSDINLESTGLVTIIK